MDAKRRAQARAVAALAATNPFSDEWTRLEKAALGAAFSPRETPWSHGHDDAARTSNLRALERLTADLAGELRRALKKGGGGADDAALYRDVALFELYNRFIPPLDELVAHGAKRRVSAWRSFQLAFAEAFDDVGDARAHPGFSAAHLFAGCFQLRRAFFHTFRFLIGASRSTARLRAAVWEAIFTRDAARYRRALVDRMRDVPTLILGPTGTGKELVARAIGLSGFVPFLEDRQMFAGDQGEGFFALHLQALSPTLVESELFGHKKGAFTGALADRLGVFAACPAWGCVFLDEVGELDEAVQIKLLRVLETRDFAPLGENGGGRFVGRVLAATHRDLAADVDAGRFRKDLFFRLAGVVVPTPSLAARVADDPAELARLVRHLAAQVAGDGEADALSADVMRALAALPAGYAWPGNVRELAQRVRAVMVGGASAPTSQAPAMPAGAAPGGWLDEARAGRLSADELVTAYVKHVHAEVGSYEGTARRVGLDRRTVKAHVAQPENGDTRGPRRTGGGRRA